MGEDSKPEEVGRTRCRIGPGRKLTREQVLMIRGSEEGVRSLARRLGVTPPLVSLARRGLTYRDV